MTDGFKTLKAPAAAGLLALTVLALGGCATTPPEEDPVIIKLNDLDRRLEKLERVLANQSLLDLAQKLESTQRDLRSLRGEVEKLQHTTEGARTQQRDLYGDLDKRVQALERGASAAAMPGPIDGATGSLPVPGGSDRANYATAFELLKGGQYEQAAAGFQQFLATFASSSLAANAQYWLGESFYMLHRYPQAQQAFRTTVEKYPGSQVAEDASKKLEKMKAEGLN